MAGESVLIRYERSILEMISCFNGKDGKGTLLCETRLNEGCWYMSSSTLHRTTVDLKVTVFYFHLGFIIFYQCFNLFVFGTVCHISFAFLLTFYFSHQSFFVALFCFSAHIQP